MESFMLRLELHICKLTVDIDYELKFCLKVKLVQRHEDGETRNLRLPPTFRGRKIDFHFIWLNWIETFNQTFR